MNEGLMEMTMLDFCTFGIFPLQIIMFAGLMGFSYEGMNFFHRRGLSDQCGFLGVCVGMAFFLAWFLVAGAIRLAAWLIS